MDLKWLKLERSLLVLLLIMSFFLFFYKLGAPSYFETDEIIYSQVAREIVSTGDWVTLHLFTKNWFIHPPMYMWLVASSSRVLGDNEFNTRIWVAIFSVGLIFVTYLLGRRMFRNGVGLLAAFILATSLQYILQARIAIFDIPLVFFIILSLLFFLNWMEDRRPRDLYLFFLSMGLAMLMKGPVGVLLPMLVIIPFLAVTGELRALFNLRLIPGIIITYLAGGTWYTIEAVIHGQRFVDAVFGFYMIGRYLTSIEQHYAPWYFYVPVILVGFIPWISFLPYSIYYQWVKKGDGNNLFTIMWLAIVFIFFTLAGTKLPGYIISFYPLAAISVAKLFADDWSGEDEGIPALVPNSYKTLAMYSVILVLIGVMFKVFEAPDRLDHIFSDLNIMFLILGVGGLAAALSSFRSRERRMPVAVLIITMLIFALYTADRTMVTLDEFKPMKAISQKVNAEYMGGQLIVGYKVLNRGSFLHYLDKPVVWIEDPNDLKGWLKTSKKLYLITNEKDFMNIGKEYSRSLFLLYKAGDMVLLINKK